MPTSTSAALAILETPYRSFEGYKTPVQFANVVDPQGTLPEIARWLGSLADGLDGLPEEIAGRAAATLRRGADRFAGLVPANA